MTRTGFRAAAAVLAVLLLAGLGWLLFAPSPSTTSGTGPERTASRAVKESGEEAEARAAASARPAPGAAGFGPREPEEEIVPRKEEPTIPGVCVLEDGTPLAGVRVSVRDLSDAEEDSVWSEMDTAVEGRFVAQPGRTIHAQHAWSRVVAMEGGTLRTSGKEADLLADSSATSIRIVFRDDPGMAHVRLVDSSSLQPILTTRGLRLSYLFGPDLGGRAVYDFPVRDNLLAFAPTDFGGWIPIRENALPEDLAIDADPAGVVVEFASPGYAAKRVPLPDIRGRMTVRVDAIPPCVTGEIRVPGTLAARPPFDLEVSAGIRPQDGHPAVDASGVRGLPKTLGPFRLDDLPQGAWVLEISATVDSAVRRARRNLEFRGTTVNLGPIDFAVGAAVRARAVDAEGTPMPQARVVVVREGEDPEKARVLAAGDDGWVAYADLEPNYSHRAVALGMPRSLEKPVQTSPDGKPVEVELTWPEKLVPCRITLVVDGKAVANPDGTRTIPATVHESPVPREVGAWNADGTFTTKLVPGTYRFSAYATPEGGGDLALFGAEVTVPSGDSFETRLELIRETR